MPAFCPMPSVASRPVDEHRRRHRPGRRAEASIEFHTTKFGPLMAARALTEADGRWPAFHAELLTLHEGFVAAEYLVVLGAKH